MPDDSDGRRDGLGESGSDDQQSPAEERYRKIFEYNNDAVIVVDFEDGEFVDVNPRACELLGYSQSELLSMHPEEIHPNDIDRVRNEFISEVTEEGAGFTDELTCLTKDSREIPTEISGAVLEPSDGESQPTRMIAMLRDISARVQPAINQMILSRILGEYDRDTYFPEWETNDWTLVDRTPYDEFTLEEWVREQS